MKPLALALLLITRLALAQALDVPLAVREGEAAPADGVWLSTSRATAIFHECEVHRRNAESLEKALVERPASPPTGIMIAGAVGLVVGAGLMLLMVRR